MDEMNVKEPEGTVTFSNEVLASMVGIAAADIPGVVGMSGGLKDGIVDLLGKKNFTKGIKVEMIDGKVKATVAIVVEYGTKIQDVCAALQKNVKQSIENMTGLEVDSVNVSVEGIKIKDQPSE